MAQRVQVLNVKAITARKNRLERVWHALQTLRLDALLVTAERDIQYLTGFIGHDSVMLVTPQQLPVIISDTRYEEFLEPWRETSVAEIVMGIRHRLHDAVRSQCEARNIKRLGIQSEHLTIARRNKLAGAIGSIELVETEGVIAGLRLTKDGIEIEAIQQAIGIQQQALRAALDQLKVGMKEIEFSALLEFEMKSRGSFAASFAPIIATGKNSSVIHYMTSDAEIQPGALLIDWGAMVDGYCSDMTRTFAFGEMPDKLRQIHAIVQEAQQTAIAAIKPGRTCAEIDAVARDFITKAGYGEQFGHGLGHGLGMDVHEQPFFNNLQTDVKLQPGMVMTVEPGIYLPGGGGVRIEDDVLVTESGCRVLSDWPRDLPSCTIQNMNQAHLGTNSRKRVSQRMQ